MVRKNLKVENIILLLHDRFLYKLPNRAKMKTWCCNKLK